jgi:hypothetical protein
MPLIECPICGSHELVPFAIGECIIYELPIHHFGLLQKW